ncbi:Nuclear transport receptor RanBP16 [Klebsormidium nitens]|uniref:Nuclear transport receptor RanBP16 n=1 Tax=Klebsormidium nitens TaxID=105231 RepID=A0A1Y1HJB8_KLENI|nr:Nuclear transport receptor RanBP16 [Klebsormidium nitens]|eukprot:GAQ78625.1 Nuclear transport receptor RanBP16 [Klebsormidium nitens]
MANMQSLAQLESLCERLYNSSNPQERAHAEQTLAVFSVNTDYISQCQYILDNSASPYAQLLASSSLVKLLTDNTLSTQLRLDIRNYVVSYLATKGPKAEPFVTTSLIQLLCRVTKLGWYDDDRHRDIVKEAMKFLAQGSLDHFYLGLKILNQLVAEMNQATPGRSLTHHRKTACSFRDLALFETFQISLTSLRQLQANADDKLREQAIGLALKCLSFDFVGTSLDESSEDLGTIQIPSSWRPVIEDTATMQLFLDYYSSTKPPLSNQALECLVRLASVRRSLFSGETERSKFLSHLMTGTREILRTQQGLSEHDNYHEYCRLLGRLKTNYQLSELVNVENYADWIRLVAEFTIKSLQSWQWASGSVYYLLGLWSRLVSSMPYLKSDSPSLLEGFVPKITEAYITSRLDSVQTVLQGTTGEDPLDNEEQLQDQLDSLPYLCRFQYEKTSKYIIALMEPLLQRFTEAGQVQGNAAQIAVMDGQLTWLVHIIGAIIRGRMSSSSAESQEVIDGELAARVFQLIQVSDTGFHAQRYQERSKQRLDSAILAFFQSFRRVYVGDQAMHSSKQLYTRLTELLGLQDHLMVLNVTVGKIATNLKCYTLCEEVIEATLNLFQELAAGYMSGKLLLKLDSVNFILANHTRDAFPFLDQYSSSRNRTMFYYTLGRLLFMEDSPAKFKAFIAPFQAIMAKLLTTPDAAFRSDAVKYALIGLFRDLRGIAMATNSRRTYGLLFDWLYPANTPLLARSVEVWTDTPEVTTPVLKFMAEFVVNKTQRLTFDSSSPNGILLFREVSKLIVSYGTRVLLLPVSSDPYANKYKGIWISLTILKAALAGNYVNFGVFELYGDRALADALDIGLKMALSVPLPDILAFRKFGRAYYSLLEVLCHNHTAVIVNLDTATFAHIMQSLEAGLKCLDVSISSQCASSVDNLAAFYFSNITVGEAPSTPAAVNLARHIAASPSLFPEILKTLFEIVLFEDCGNQWSLSRPMLSLILINEQIFNDLKAQILATQAPDQQQRLAGCFDKLMADVTRTLEPKNRDKFTQNLTIFRHDFRAK